MILPKNFYTRSEVFRKGNISLVVFSVITPHTMVGTTNISDKDTASIFQVKLKMKAVYSSTYQPTQCHNSHPKYVRKKFGSSLLPHNYSTFALIQNTIPSTNTKLTHNLPGSTQRDDLAVQVKNPTQAWLEDHVHF